MLDSTATLEIARGLQHPNSQVARTAYRTLDAQIAGWSQLQSSLAAARMRALAQRLCELPDTTPADNLVLASSLASRIFSLCLELDDPQLAPVMAACESVFQRVGRSGSVPQAPPVSPVQVASNVVSGSELERLGQQIDALQPLSSQATTAGGQATAAQATAAQATAELALTGLAPIVPAASAERSAAEPIGLVPSIAPRDVLHSSSSTPTAKVQFLTAAAGPHRVPQPQPHSSDAGRGSYASATLSDAQGADAERSAVAADSEAGSGLTGPQPSVVHGPASVRSKPLAEMPSATADVDLNSIQQLDINALVRLLPSQQPRVAQAAALALRSKGFPDDRLALASQLATSPPLERIRLLQSIATDPNVEPRPWLLWMAEIGEVEVKQQAIGLLSSMAQDLNMQQDLRRLLAQESDESVAQAIRQVLFARRTISR